MIDYHCHLLPALDDGASDLAASLEMARILADFGFTTVHCTPHLIRGGFDNDPDKVTRATAELQRELQLNGIPLRLVPGTEHYLDEFLPQFLPDALTFDPAGTLLLELPSRGGTELLHVMVSQLLAHGKRPLIAHPERCAAFAPSSSAGSGGLRNPFGFLFKKGAKRPPSREGIMHRLRDSGCHFQANIGSFAGFYGREVKERALLFLREGLYSCVGSDAHRPSDLAGILAAGYRAVASEAGEAAAYDLFTGKGLS